MKRACRLVILLVLLPLSLAFAQTNTPVPALADIKADFDAAKYQDVIKKSIRALGSKPDKLDATSQPPDRGAIEALKAESHLRLKQFPQATEAFTAAAKDSTDPKDVGLYRATALLIKRSPGGKYAPKRSADAKDKPEPIDIVAADSRKQAFAALYTAESKTVQARVDSIKNRQTLKPIMDLLRDALDLRAVELAGTASDDGTKKMLADLSDQAGKLMGDAVKNLSTAVEKIATTANETTQQRIGGSYGPGETVTTKRGLNSTDKKTLEDVIATCKDVEQQTDQLVTALGSDAGAVKEVQQSAAALSARATEVVNGDYGDKRSRADNTVQGGNTGNTGNPRGTQNPRR